MSLQDVEVKQKVYINGKEAWPFIPDALFSDSKITPWNEVSISGSASDETVAITDLGTVKALWLEVDPDDRDKITVKYNGSSKAYSVSPIEATTENITALTASNSDTAAVKVRWRALTQES